MSQKPFTELSRKKQVDLMRIAAGHSLEKYKFQPSQIRLQNHGYNTTFRVYTAEGKRFALRLNLETKKSIEQLNGEIFWVQQLAADYPGLVPNPEPTSNGDLVHFIQSPIDGEPMASVLYSWLDGRCMKVNASFKEAEQLGISLKKLHDHSATWNIPATASVKPLEDATYGVPWNLSGHPEEQIFSELNNQANELIQKLNKKIGIRPMHCDIHFYNLKFNNGVMSIFDFDDMMQSFPAMDLSIIFFYIRRSRNSTQIEKGILSGLGLSSVEDLGVSKQEFELLIAARSMLLVNDVIQYQNAELQSVMPKFIHKSVWRTRRYFETGRFNWDVEFPAFEEPTTK